jgi:chemotaxis family two-component system sensor kinase Cph1
LDSSANSSPAFGQADLSNCEREQIHLAASIQPHGTLLVLRESDLVVIQASVNAAAFLELDADPLGTPLARLKGDLAERLRLQIGDSIHILPKAFRCHVGRTLGEFDALAHRVGSKTIVVELERSGPSVDVSGKVDAGLQRILFSSSLAALCDEAARIFKDLIGYDRVMVYRFNEDGHGEVYSEQRNPELEPLLGNRYPATDIPQIARRLYERNRIRLLVDVGYTPVPIQPRLLPDNGGELDMSLCGLRSISPIHIQYLKNMGVDGTLVASLMVGGKLWGLIASHHYAPRIVQYELRAACELLAEAMATRIAALESFAQAQAELSVRRLEQRMTELLSREGDWRGALFDGVQSLLKPVGATGAALLLDGQIQSLGDVPSTECLRRIGAWLDTKASPEVVATNSLSSEEAQFKPVIPIASGLLAVAISNLPGEYILWFRPEQVRTIVWGGNPTKPFVIGNDPADLSPRRSFAQWHQVMEGHSESWSQADLAAARLIGVTVKDIVLQSRSVRMLIAENQLEQVRSQVTQSQMPVVVMAHDGRVLLANAAVETLLDRSAGGIRSIADLPDCFSDPAEVRSRLDALFTGKRTWRGEVFVKPVDGMSRPLLVRADPVFASADQVLGFVLLFTDLSQQKAAQTARRRFQEGIVEGHRVGKGPLATKEEVIYQGLLSAVVENAQLAALEIADRADLARMPDLLESVRNSVKRATELLRHLIWLASRGTRK